MLKLNISNFTYSFPFCVLDVTFKEMSGVLQLHNVPVVTTASFRHEEAEHYISGVHVVLIFLGKSPGTFYEQNFLKLSDSCQR